MKIVVHQSQKDGLLLCGVPFAEGEVTSGAGFVLTDARGETLPLWWEERARWPDGSVKWIFLHSRLESGATEVELETGEGKAGSLALSTEASLELDGTRLEFAGDHWSFAAGDQKVRVCPGWVITDPELESRGKFELELVEASPLAPLLRWRQKREDGLRFDHLLRINPAQKMLYWQQRLSFLQEGTCRLQRLGASLMFPNGGWTWAVDGSAHRRLAVLRPGIYVLDDGAELAGYPQASLQIGSASLTLEKGWQRAPFAIEVEENEVRLDFFPQEAEPLTVHEGTSFRHAVRIGLAGGDVEPVAWSLDPETACGTGAFGPLMACTERTQRFFPGYEQAMETCMEGGRLTRLDKERGDEKGRPAVLEKETDQDEEYFGLQHYGDWPMSLGSYGGEERMYADNEYDAPFAYFLQFARTGRPAYCEVAYHSALHMADVDCKATNGDMHYHGYHEQAEDHAEHRSPGGELGHYWTDGLVLNYLLNGDGWSWEAALAQARFLLRLFTGEGDDAIRRHFLNCERAVGWPLTALAGVAEVTNDREIVDKMRQMAAFLARFTADPDRELEEVTRLDGKPLKWWRICQGDGTKPFMLGVVLEGLERYHRLTGDPAAKTAIVNICRFLVEVMWEEEIEAFIYEWNAFNRSHREDVYPHYINMMVAPGLAYAYELTGEEQFREVATRSFHAALWTLFSPGGGKEIGMVGRTSATMVGRLHEWKQRREEKQKAQLLPSNGIPFSFAGEPEGLMTLPELVLRQGRPRYEEGALVSNGDSYAVYGFHDPVNTDRGEIEFTFAPDWDCPPHPGPVEQRAYLHLCDRPFTRSCVSIISFYTGLHVRFYDAERHYVEVLETDIQHWKAGKPHRVRVTWNVEEGTAALWLDGEEMDRRGLNRRLSGSFKRLHVGHRPGNWRADGRIGELQIRLG